MEAGQGPEDRLVRSFVEGAECKRRILDGYLDGRRVQIGCEEEEVECEVCRDGRQVGMQETRVMEHEEEEEQEEVSSEEEMEGEVEERQQEELSSEGERDEDVEELEAAQLERQAMADEHMTATKEVVEEAEGLRRYLENICGTCSFCRWRLGEKREHVLFRCRELKGFNARNRFKVLQGMIRKMWCMAQYSGCTECFVLMEWCNRFEGRGLGSQGGAKTEWVRRQGPGLCQFDEMVLGEYVVALEGDEEFRLTMAKRMRELGLEWVRDEDRIRYFGLCEEWDMIEGNKLLWELGRFVGWYKDV